MQAGPSQQRDEYAARTLHHAAEVLTQPTAVDIPFYDYLTIIIIVTYYYCMALYILQPFVFSYTRLTSTSHDLSPSVIHPVYI